MSRYHTRLNSRRWARVRRRLFDAAGWRCAACGDYGNEVEQIVAASEAGDDDMLGGLLRRAKPQIAHGAWLMFLDKLGIHTRRAQRLMANSPLIKSAPSDSLISPLFKGFISISAETPLNL